MGRAVKQECKKPKAHPHVPTSPSMSERYGFRKLNMSASGPNSEAVSHSPTVRSTLHVRSAAIGLLTLRRELILLISRV
jgi:hypothetical protein